MRQVGARVVCVAVLLVVALAGAQAPTVTATFRDTPIQDVAAQLAASTGRDIIVAEDVQGTISAAFDQQPLEQVLRLIARVHGLKLQPVGDAFLLSRPAAEAPAPEGPPRITIVFNQTPIRDALRALNERYGIDFIIAGDVRGAITAEFAETPLDEVLKTLALGVGAEVELVDNIFIFRKPAAAPVAGGAEPLPAREGAGALLPGEVPRSVLREAGDRPTDLVGGAAAQTNEKPPVITAQIPIENRTPQQIAALLGVGYVDSQGRYHPPGETAPTGGTGLPPAGNPYANLPPEARITRNGTILLPNGVTILPSGVVIGPDGTVYPPRAPGYITVPWGTGLPQGMVYTNPNQQVLGGTIGGVNFGVTQGGGVTIQPPTIQLGGVTVQLPGVTTNPNPNGQPVGGQVPQVRITSPTQTPGVHFGQRPTNWYYGLPPGWHYTPPTGTPNIHFGFTQPLTSGEPRVVAPR